MERTSVFAAFSIPALLALFALGGLVFGVGADGWSDLIYGVQLAIALIAALLVGVAFFLLRKRKIHWGYWLLLSFASVAVALGLLVLFVRAESFFAPAPSMVTESGIAVG